MGNTIFAHAAYACDKIKLDLREFWSSTGDAHKIRNSYLHNELIPVHMDDKVNIPKHSCCIIEIKTSYWYKLLETKMLYCKYRLQEPNYASVQQFFTLHNQYIDHQALWQDFYQNFKDPLWPVCDTYNDIQHLPKHIQNEIHKKYQSPEVGVTENNWISLLSYAFYDTLLSSQDHRPIHGGVTFLLDDYFSMNVDIVKNQITKHLGWIWDDQKSLTFHQHALKNNQVYTQWLSKLKKFVSKTVDGQIFTVNIDPWEKALLAALCCVYFDIDPKKIPLHVIAQFDTNTHLIKILKENYGKTI